MTFSKEFMQQASKRIDELKQETIDASKKIPNSEDYVKAKVGASGIVSYSKCKKCHKTLPISNLKANPEGIGKVCIDQDSCKERVKNLSN